MQPRQVTHEISFFEENEFEDDICDIKKLEVTWKEYNSLGKFRFGFSIENISYPPQKILKIISEEYDIPIENISMEKSILSVSISMAVNKIIPKKTALHAPTSHAMEIRKAIESKNFLGVQGTTFMDDLLKMALTILKSHESAFPYNSNRQDVNDLLDSDSKVELLTIISMLQPKQASAYYDRFICRYLIRQLEYCGKSPLRTTANEHNTFTQTVRFYYEALQLIVSSTLKITNDLLDSSSMMRIRICEILTKWDEKIALLSTLESVQIYHLRMPAAEFKQLTETSEELNAFDQKNSVAVAAVSGFLNAAVNTIKVFPLTANLIGKSLSSDNNSGVAEAISMLEKALISIENHRYLYACRANVRGDLQWVTHEIEEVSNGIVNCYVLHTASPEKIRENKSSSIHFGDNPNGRVLVFTDLQVAQHYIAFHQNQGRFDPLGGFNINGPWTDAEKEKIYTYKKRKHLLICSFFNEAKLPSPLQSIMLEYLSPTHFKSTFSK